MARKRRKRNPWYVTDKFGVVASGPHATQDAARDAIRALRSIGISTAPGRRASLAADLRRVRREFPPKRSGSPYRRRTVKSASWSYRVGQEVPRLAKKRKNSVGRRRRSRR